MDYAAFRDAPGFLHKPEPRKRSKARAKRVKVKSAAEVRAYCFGRDRALCRICRIRRAESLHELRFRSLGGKVSRTNSIAVCGSGTTGCHNLAQRNEIRYRFDDEAVGADGLIVFIPETARAAEQMHVKLGESLLSPPMVAMEED